MAFQRQVQNYTLGVGANNVSYIPDFSFPLYNFFGDGGIVTKFKWDMIQGSQYWVNPALKIIGNPGIQNGQGIGQPQLDTRGITF